MIGHHGNECSSIENKSYMYGETRHLIADCKGNVVTCYNCGEQGHISNNFQKPKKDQSGRKGFALSGKETTSADRLIRGTCFYQ